MKVIDPGHLYYIDVLDSSGPNQMDSITFVKREGQNFPFNLGAHSGTNCQEVIRVLIDRTKFLNSQEPCFETEAALGALEAALALYELRAARKHKRFLELVTTSQLVSAKTCDKCKHIQCPGDCR